MTSRHDDVISHLVLFEERLQRDDGLALVFLGVRRALAVPAGQVEGLEVQEGFQAGSVVVDEREVLVLHGAAHL